MLKFKNIHTQRASVRFRRYNRKAYAMFCSLGKNVTIGTLASYITDAQILKSLGSLNFKEKSSDGHISEEDKLSCVGNENLDILLFSDIAKILNSTICTSAIKVGAADIIILYKNLTNREFVLMTRTNSLFFYLVDT